MRNAAPPAVKTGALVLAGALVAIMGGCSAPAPTRVDGPTGQTSQAITTTDVMTAAALWVTDAVPYCGGIRGGTDSICGGTCNRPSEPWNDYRSDCSGYVSWCWQITDDPTTDVYMSDRAGSNGWATITIDDLNAGDAVVCDGHIKLFSKFASTTSAQIYEESDCGLVAHTAVQTFTRTGNTLLFDGDSRVYHPIRRNGITSADWGAQYVSQSWPLATTAMKMTVNETIAADLTMMNIGTKPWNSSTKLATSNPRDRVSAFVAPDWPSSSRLSAVSGTVVPGASYKFTFSFHAPSTPGTYHEYFGLVEDGVAWFSDAGQGGPADTVLEAWIEVEAGDGGAVGAGDADAAAADAGSSDGGAFGADGDAASGGGEAFPSDAGVTGDASVGSNGGTTSGGSCAMRGTRDHDGVGSAMAMLLGAAFLLSRRRRTDQVA